MTGWRSHAIAIVALQSGVAQAQSTATGEAASTTEVASQPVAAAPPTETIWVAGASGGLLARDGGPDSPYGTLSLTRYRGGSYIRGALTAYRGTVRQIDAALPATYVVGSVGAGGNWKDWVVDGFASYGRQYYGQVETFAGKRDSQAGSGAPYLAVGVRAGRVFRPAPHWYVTPTIGVQYSDTKSLRHRVDFMSGRAEDFQLRERAWTGNATLRVDRAIGKQQQHFVGLSLAHYESSNGLTSWGIAGTPPQNQVRADPTPDSWQEVGMSATWQLSKRLWLDNQVQRTFGAVAGDSTTVTLGLRVRF